MRGVAADVGVDPALIIRYFGSEQELLAEVAEFRIDPPDLSTVDPDRIADVLLSRFFAVWEQDTTFLALLRAAMTSESAADILWHVFATQVAPALAAVAPDHPAQRAGLMAAFVIGLATTRYALRQFRRRRAQPRGPPAFRAPRDPPTPAGSAQRLICFPPH